MSKEELTRAKDRDKQLLQRQLANIQEQIAELTLDAKIIAARIHGKEPGVTHEWEEGHHKRRIISYKEIVREDRGDDWIEALRSSKDPKVKLVSVTTHHWAKILVLDNERRPKRKGKKTA